MQKQSQNWPGVQYPLKCILYETKYFDKNNEEQNTWIWKHFVNTLEQANYKI